MIPFSNKEVSFETSDLNLAATLHALGASIISINRRDAGRCVFIFEDAPDLHRAVQAYWRHELALDPQAVLLSLKALKGRLYNENSV